MCDVLFNIYTEHNPNPNLNSKPKN